MGVISLAKYFNKLTINLVKNKLNVGDIINYKEICNILKQPYC